MNIIDAINNGLLRAADLKQIEMKAIARFAGKFDELEAALGMLHLGDYLGWKPLVLIHNKRTLRKYEEILDIEIKTLFPEEGPGAAKSRGYMVAKKIGNFWKCVSGEIANNELKRHRRELESNNDENK